jgi:putative DNA primase/helicase
MAEESKEQQASKQPKEPEAIKGQKKYLVVARDLMAKQRFINIASDSDEENAEELLYYSGGVYVTGGKTLVRQLLAKYYPELCNSYFNHQVITLIKQNTIIERRVINPAGYIGVLNGNLLLDEHGVLLGLLPHTPDIYLTSQIPVAFKPGVGCMKIKNFLLDLVTPDEAQIIIEFIGYCLYSLNVQEKWLLLVGAGENGKTRLIQLIKKFLGEENVTHQTLQALVGNRFATSSLFGKLANIVGDLSSAGLNDTGMIKTLTSGDGVMGEKKFKDAFKFVPSTKLIMATNKPPKISKSEQTHAFFRRILYIKFNRQFREGNVKRDPFILEKISTPEELSGLLNVSLAALEKVLRVGFTCVDTPEDVKRKYNNDAADEDDVTQECFNNFMKNKSRGANV